MHTRTRLACAMGVIAAALCACGKPQPPERDQPPEPQAATPAVTGSPLQETIQAPIDRAKQADAQVQAAADRQRAAIDAATGG